MAVALTAFAWASQSVSKKEWYPEGSRKSTHFGLGSMIPEYLERHL